MDKFNKTCKKHVSKNKNRRISTVLAILVEGDGFEPSKQEATDLQSAPFGHSGTPPY